MTCLQGVTAALMMLSRCLLAADNYAEEQSLEVEALESIYAEDFKKTSDAPVLQWQVHLEPYQSGEGENHGEQHTQMVVRGKRDNDC